MQSAFQPIRDRVLRREILSGTFINLGSSVTTEIAGRSGLDWLLIDLEHSAGDEHTLLTQLQAVSATPACPIVRIPHNDPWRFKRILDLGASGIMVPWISSVREAEQVVSAMRYAPDGIRGVANLNRASGFGRDFKRYFAEANHSLLTIVQIEQPEALEVIDDIAAVEGVDVLFLGPLDMSVSMGIPQDYDHPDFKKAKQRIADAAFKAGKAAGTLLMSPDQLQETVEQGYTMVAIGSDGGVVAKGMQQIARSFDSVRSDA